MSELRHDKVGDVAILSSMVQLVPPHRHVVFAAALLGRDLMRGPWWMRGLVWCVASIRGWAKTTTWHLFLNRFQRGLPEQVITAFSSHILFGEDASDTRSIGGLNQREMDDTVFLLRNCLHGVEIHPTYRAVLDTNTATGGDHG